MSKRASIVIDASVFVAAAVSEEVDHGEAFSLLSRLPELNFSLHVPTLAILEVSAALARRTARPSAGRVAGERILEMPGITIHQLTYEQMTAGLRLLAHAPLRGADLVYATLAQFTDSVLVTLDREMLKAAAKAIVVRRPRDLAPGKPER